MPVEVGRNFQIIFGVGAGTGEEDIPPPSVEFYAGNLELPAPASRPSPSRLFFFSFLFFREAGGGGPARAGGSRSPARVPSGGAGLSAAVSAPRASHHLAEPLLKTHPSVRAEAAFLPEKNHC